jgi:hypothetical protein
VETIPGLALRRDFTTWKTSITSSVSALSKRFNRAQNTPVCWDPSLLRKQIIKKENNFYGESGSDIKTTRGWNICFPSWLL